MTNKLQAAREISDRRIAYLEARGENLRNTVAWQDAIAEARQLGLYTMLCGGK